MTSEPAWREEPIDRHHDRRGFDCGVPALNEYLSRYARQNHAAGRAKTFVAAPLAEPARVLGFYSIAPSSIDFEKVPAEALKRLGSYDVPVFRLARLAVDIREQGRQLGSRLLVAAARRASKAAASVGGVGLAIDAKDEAAAGWYLRFGAAPLRDSPLKLILLFDVLADAIRRADDGKFSPIDPSG